MSDERVVFREQGGADFTVIEVDAVANRTGEKMTLHFASVKDDRPGAVCVTVLKGSSDSDERQYLIARHWRASVGQWEWEFPRGMGEPGETVEETSVRELREETGICAGIGQVRVLQMTHADTGVLRDNVAVTAVEFTNDEQRREVLKKIPFDNQRLSPVHNVDLESESRSRIDWELSHIRWVGESDLKQYIAQEQIVDGITLSSFFLYLLYIGESEQ